MKIKTSIMTKASGIVFALCFALAAVPAQAQTEWDELENWVVESQAEDSAVEPVNPPPPAPLPIVSEDAGPEVKLADIQSAGTDVAAASIESPAAAPLEPAPVTEKPAPAPAALPSTESIYNKLPKIPQPSAPASEGEAKETRRVRRPVGGKAEKKPPVKNLFAENFYMPVDQRLKHRVVEVKDMIFIETPGSGGQLDYALVTDFGGSVIQTQQVKGLHDTKEVKDWMKTAVSETEFDGVKVKKVDLAFEGQPARTLYLVGHRSFAAQDEAAAEVALTRTMIESTQGNFDEMVKEAQRYVAVEEQQPVQIATEADFEKQERVVLKMLDALDIGEKPFGPFQGNVVGQNIIWQSFGETTWRNTNLSDHDFNEQVGFWTNRFVFKGIKAPLNTIDPFVEATVALESDGVDFKDTMKLYAGLEWRPLENNPWLYNFRPWSLPLLEWVRNYRFYVMYGDRKPLKDEIETSADHDIIYGVQIFYEWGIDLPSASEGRRETIPDYLREYVWGEYFGNYRFEATNFGSEEDFDAWILNSSVILGIRLPGIPLPENPINDELVLMPYVHFEHVNNTRFAFPFQNQYFVGVGVRWMPFRTYRFKENEWLSKVKVFGEYVGVGQAQHFKQDGEAPNAVRTDWRIGVNISSRRF